MRIPEAPLFRDPIFDGAADPTVIWNEQERQWWMVYTQRRTTCRSPGVAWVHATDLGVASSPDGHDWLYRGTLEGLHFEPGRNTWWAPELIFADGVYHLYPSYIQGVPDTWNRPRCIVHYTSRDLWHWQYEGALSLSSDRVIDACVARISPELWRMWYKDEKDNSYSHYADSPDLFHWEERGRAVTLDCHEGPNVFRLAGRWWYIGDFWHGQEVFRSGDCLSWEHCGCILGEPGTRPFDQTIGRHGDVVVQGDEAYLFYFTHLTDSTEVHDGTERPTSIQVARLTSDGERLFCDRSEPFDFCLRAPF